MSTTTATNRNQAPSRRHLRRQQSSLFKGRAVARIEVELEHVTYSPASIRLSKNSKGTEKKTVLSDISTIIAPGKLTAWMGPSGSGKTSLISVAAGLINPSDLHQDSVIKVNGEEGSIPKRLVGVVWQDDLLLSNLTVEETIYFNARLKTPATTSEAQVRTIVEDTMAELGIAHIRDSLIGNPFSRDKRGISGGERKRVSVASELVARPPLLFLDEPTSGLDSTSAEGLIQALKMLTVVGHSIAVVIHQPRTTTFNLFDNLLLLSHGKTVFNGRARDARAHLESCPGVGALPSETGIADWIIDTIAEDEGKEPAGLLVEHWAQPAKSTEQADSDSDEEVVQLGMRKTGPSRRLSLVELRQIKKYESSFSTQLSLLTVRTLKQHRGDHLTTVAAMLTAAYTFFTCVFWGRLANNTNRVFERNSLLFFMLISQSNQVAVASVSVFARERALLSRERAKKLYRVLPYFLAKTLSDMTDTVLLPCVYASVTYWVTGLRPTAENYILYIFSFYLSLATAQSMGLFLSIAIRNIQVALMLAPSITLFFVILSGFYVPVANMHIGIRWMAWLSFAHYGYSSYLINEFAGRDIPCTDDVTVQVGESDECPVPGDEVLETLGITGISSNYWFNVGMMTLLQIFFRWASYTLLRRSK